MYCTRYIKHFNEIGLAMVVTVKFETDSKMHIHVAEEFIGSILLSEIIAIFGRPIIHLVYKLYKTF